MTMLWLMLRIIETCADNIVLTKDSAKQIRDYNETNGLKEKRISRAGALNSLFIALFDFWNHP